MNKKNIAVFGLTKSNREIGAFTSEGFSNKAEAQDIHSFIFSAYKNKIKILKLKKGKRSTQADKDYLIFGSEELSFQYNSNVVSSYFDSNP